MGKRFTKRFSSSMAALVLSGALVACSGGGGGSGGSGGSGSTPPPPPTPPTSQIENTNEAVRFLSRATFGASWDDAQALVNRDASAWFRTELSKNPTLFTAAFEARTAGGGTLPNNAATSAYWEAMIEADDQLRQRMVFALSQILVVSDGPGSGLTNKNLTMAAYMDILSRNAFGNYRDLLEDVTYSVAMARYLTFLSNRKGDEARGRMPDENYAREIMQLFTIGLVELNPDGTPRTDAQGNEIETYDNDDVVGLARVFTGLSWDGPRFNRLGDAKANAEWIPLIMFDGEHSPLEKSFLGTTIAENTPGEQSIDLALDALFNHPNTAPFISRQLIQRFTVSDPSPAYVRRVATAFETGRYTLPDNSSVGTGRRGDLSATLAAILFDQSLVDVAASPSNTTGKVREPVIRFVNWARAFDLRDVTPENERWLASTSNPDRLSQHPFRSPSVFNFYRPGFVAPNSATGDANLVAPELQIVNESAFSGYIDFMTRYVRDDTPVYNAGQASFTPDYTDELALADRPTVLLDRLDTLLTGGRLDPAARALIIESLEALPFDTGGANETDDRLRRVELAILMVVASPQYFVQP